MRKPIIGIVAFVFFGFAVACQSEEEEDLEERSLDEHACDEAAAKLAACCPGVRKETIGCRVQTSTGGCDTRTTTTDVLITMHDADECILHSSCSELQDQGVCDALPTAVRASHGTSSGDMPSSTRAVSVCPSLRDPWMGSSSSSSSSSGGAALPAPPSKSPTNEEDAGAAAPSCEGDASTCSWYFSELQCESMGCTWVPR